MSNWTHGYNPTFQKIFNLWFKNQKVGRLLDVGCADGSFCIPLVEMGWECYGVDKEKQKIVVDMPVEIVDIESEKLPFNNNFFDVVFAGEIIEHLRDPKFFLGEVKRVLKENGVFILTTPNIVYLRDRVRVLFGKRQIALEMPFHYRCYTFDCVEEILKENGFVVEERRGSYFLKSTLPFAYKISDIYPKLLSTQIILKVRKC